MSLAHTDNNPVVATLLGAGARAGPIHPFWPLAQGWTSPLCLVGAVGIHIPLGHKEHPLHWGQHLGSHWHFPTCSKGPLHSQHTKGSLCCWSLAPGPWGRARPPLATRARPPLTTRARPPLATRAGPSSRSILGPLGAASRCAGMLLALFVLAPMGFFLHVRGWSCAGARGFINKSVGHLSGWC